MEMAYWFLTVFPFIFFLQHLFLVSELYINIKKGKKCKQSPFTHQRESNKGNNAFVSLQICFSAFYRYTIFSIFKSTLWHYGNSLVKNIQDDTEMLLIICRPTSGIHHDLYTGCHWGVKRFQDLRSDPVWDLLGDQSPACNRHFPCAIFSWPWNLNWVSIRQFIRLF